MRFLPAFLLVAAFTTHVVQVVPAHAQANCQLCTPQEGPARAAPERPVKIDIDTELNFGLAAHDASGSGSIRIDPATGLRSTQGGLVALGGSGFRGTARITGQPFARVRIDFPRTTRMHAPQGGSAEIVDLVASIPTVATLDATGQLSFSFSGRFAVSGGAEGDFRGRIAIVADYE